MRWGSAGRSPPGRLRLLFLTALLQPGRCEGRAGAVVPLRAPCAGRGVQDRGVAAAAVGDCWSWGECGRQGRALRPAVCLLAAVAQKEAGVGSLITPGRCSAAWLDEAVCTASLNACNRRGCGRRWLRQSLAFACQPGELCGGCAGRDYFISVVQSFPCRYFDIWSKEQYHCVRWNDV